MKVTSRETTRQLPSRDRPGVTVGLLIALGIVVAAVILPGAAASAAGPVKPQVSPDRVFATPVQEAGAGAAVSASRVCPRLRSLARQGNSRAGMQVRNLRSGKVVCGLNPSGMRSLASNTKLFTTATALARLGPDHRFRTRTLSSGRIDGNGTLHGNLYLKGGGDPALGTTGFMNSYLGGAGTSISALAKAVRRKGIRRVTGRLIGDDTVFDGLRGVADSGYATSPWIGPLSGLSMNAGYTGASLSRFSSNPAKLAARTLARSLKAHGIAIRPEIAMKRAPAGAKPVARLLSPDLTWNARVTNLNSNNFFAEMLLKNIGATVRGKGTTHAGAVVVRRFAASQGVKVKPVDGSGLTRSNRSSAKGVVRLLIRARHRPWGRDLLDSLPAAGRDGTLGSRMRGSAAEGRCRAKTGTLTGVSALSGYCFNKSGRRFAFSILMNGVRDSYSARLAQDRIAALIARL